MVASPRTQRVRRRSSLAVLLVATGILLAFTGSGPFGATASAQNPVNPGANVPSIPTGAASQTYPDDAILPAGCVAGSVLTGLQYQIDPDGTGAAPAGAPRGDLAFGDIPPGATIIMTWSGWSQDCASVISLSVKRAEQATFNPNSNQDLISFAACEADGDGCTVAPGSFRLELTMPTIAAGGCFYQVDAVVGPPLDVVGPNGSFYHNDNRSLFPATMNETGDNMLIHANNGRAICPAAETTTTTLATTTTTLATTTTTSATTTTSDPGTTTTSVLSTTLTQPSTSTTGATVLGVTVTQPRSGNLPRTGSDGEGPRTALAIGFVLTGFGVALFGRDRKLGWQHRS